MKIIDSTCMWIYDHTYPVHVALMNATHSMKQNTFYNYANAHATGLEAIANLVLTPVRYFFDGKTFSKIAPNNYSIESSCDYLKDSPRKEMIKTILAVLTLPFTLIIGGALKGISFLSPHVRASHKDLREELLSSKTQPQDAVYKRAGVDTLFSDEVLEHQKIPAPPPTSKQAVQIQTVHDVSKVLESANIPHWIWCGTLLGAFRHGQIIPWDTDVDMVIPAVEHMNAFKTLRNKLDPSKYIVQDWSGSKCPNMYIRIMIKGTDSYMDLYHNTINEREQSTQYHYALRDSQWVPDSVKQREFVCEKPSPLSDIFPLKKAWFGDKLVRVPHKWEAVLRSTYGENLAPCKVWNTARQQYEKVAGHPYWETHEY